MRVHRRLTLPYEPRITCSHLQSERQRDNSRTTALDVIRRYYRGGFFYFYFYVSSIFFFSILRYSLVGPKPEHTVKIIYLLFIKWVTGIISTLIKSRKSFTNLLSRWQLNVGIVTFIIFVCACVCDTSNTRKVQTFYTIYTLAARVRRYRCYRLPTVLAVIRSDFFF